MDKEDPGVTVTARGFEYVESSAIIDEELAILEGCVPAIIDEMLRRCEQEAEGVGQ
ncbi:MAG TPA: hypothetical protein VMQ10_11610 [Spirochaetia bacterium]|nr:hypothetical protein [Spirochaetia bacterium]